ncbi:MAG: bifunctional [glutamate--ammonia ligase]-adenylyl-L-tyrosine phosphorylase/[glutamate--ammonia-ligase] adenylyltransferase [Magnetococcales bacterium]|nr:bifunctional [glutamate--ammonia ligase]-adenylyl-L-tyrosine phosphorylase/[glutamate--ammonia-ligase] adenylyltransferase [Magnetococcales bacterium]
MPVDKQKWTLPGLSSDLVEAVATGARQTAEPDGVMVRLDRFMATHEDNAPIMATLIAGLNDPLWQRRLVLALGNSPFLANIIQRWPHLLQEIMADATMPDPVSLQDQVCTAVMAADSLAAAEQTLRTWKHREFLRIGMLDLAGEIPLSTTTQALTALAEACLEGGYRWLDRSLSALLGYPMVEKEGLPPAPSRFTILGMGKLGARELNFSSDIDLIYLYDHDDGKTTGPRPVSIKEYYTRLGRDLIKLLSGQTADGMVFRVDLRLRPEGESGDLALSCRSAEIYYESWGQTWERAAMIKARPVAGDVALGGAFLERLRPFVFRRYLDFAALDAIREMKQRIDHKIKQRADYQRNLKLGFGGIREIEFFVQSQQLIRGGGEPRLRQRETIPTLHMLGSLGLVDPATVQQLAEAYVVLRTLEHRLQIEREQQLHSLPEEAEALARLARRAGFNDANALMIRIKDVTSNVHRAYHGLFLASERVRQEISDPLVASLLAGDLRSEAGLTTLCQAGFVNPERARQLLDILQNGPPGVALPETTLRWYRPLAPLLLGEILRASDQDMALENTEAFLLRIGARANYLALMVEHPLVLHLLIPLFGASPFLSRYLNLHPELMDSLITRDFLEKAPDRSRMSQALTELSARAEDDEERMRILHEFKNTEMLRIGIRDLSDITELPETMTALSTLAEVILTQVMLDARQALEKRHGIPAWTTPEGIRRPAQFVILALGKLGGRELTYASDLDLIFVHDGSGDAQYTDGERSLANGVFFTRLGQKIISTINTMTRSGRLYELDMRLRPSGNSGPLVTALESFLHYQNRDAWTWEHQALTRLRVVAGDLELANHLNAAVRDIMRLPRDAEVIGREIGEMRARIAREKGPARGSLDIKLSLGGVVDIEFLTQYFILSHASVQPRLHQRSTMSALLAAGDAGLLPPDEVTRLTTTYLFLRLVESRLRLLHDRPENRLGSDPVLHKRLARLCHLEAGGEIIPLLQEHFQGVREICRRHLPGYPTEEQPEH